MAQEVEIAVLESSSSDDVFNGRIPDVADREDNGCGSSGDRPEVVSETEHWPVVVDGAEVCVKGVGKFPVANELRPDRDVCAGLEGRANGLFAPRLNFLIRSSRLRLTFVVE